MGCSGSSAAATDGQSSPSRSGTGTQSTHSERSVRSATSFSSKYDLCEKLGEGGFARVHRSRGKLEGDDSAVKIIDMSGSAHKTAVLRGRADDEVSIWKRIGKHEHCVTFLEAFVEGTDYHMVMEKCGDSLLDRLDVVRNSGAAGISRVIREMLYASQHMHSRDVVHRDIKPANYLFGGANEETLKLCDFGLSTVVPKTGIPLRARGSPSYMSPEVIAETCVSTKSDVWSLGVTAYVVLYARLPYEMPDGDNRDATRTGEPAPCYAVLTGVEPNPPPEGAEGLCRQLLTRDERARCTAEEALHHEFVWQRTKCERESSCTTVPDTGSCASNWASISSTADNSAFAGLDRAVDVCAAEAHL